MGFYTKGAVFRYGTRIVWQGKNIQVCAPSASLQGSVTARPRFPENLVSSIPKTVSDSGLWNRLTPAHALQEAITSVRDIAEKMAAKAAETVPDFTDHSVEHMDALWAVCDKVFTPKELALFTPGESFILGCAFYVHDLGMAVGATEAGRVVLEASSTFAATKERLVREGGLDEKSAQKLALRQAARDLHAPLASSLIDNELPGLKTFLIEKKEIRQQWGGFVGKVSESHHWPLRQVDSELGARGLVPGPGGEQMDLGVVACALRVIDYAHVNYQRARILDRLLRSEIALGSIPHWDAQEFITGPAREGNFLVYGAMRPIEDVDAWWTFYEIVRGLDAEIQAVLEYLRGRASSSQRFSLEGVKGVSTPQNFAVSVPSGRFEPVDVRFRPDSMDRLVSILGGDTLYGNDRYAPIRELLQNAADAIQLRMTADAKEGIESTPGQILVSVDNAAAPTSLSVTDNGAGMSERVITNYLLGVASDYWHSPDYYADFPAASSSGFKPVGRFGIGFLSVFMMGDVVEVSSQRRGADALALKLHGVGRRGSLVRGSPRAISGTTVKVTLRKLNSADYGNIATVARAKAPMLSLTVKVRTGDSETEITPKWWQTITQEELVEFLAQQPDIATTPPRELAKRSTRERYYHAYRAHRYRVELQRLGKGQKWPTRQPEIITNDSRVIAVPSQGHVLLCSKGFAIGSHPIPGIVGLAEIGEVELNAARTTPLKWDSEAFRNQIISELRPHLLDSLNKLSNERSIPSRHAFLVSVARAYDADLLTETMLTWITIVEPPGNAILVSPADLESRLKTNNEVVITFGNSGPWDIEGIARARWPEAGRDALFIPIASDDQTSVGSYEDRDQVYSGPLEQHFEQFGGETGIKGAFLLSAVLKTIAQAWNVPIKSLHEATWSRFNRVLSGHLVKGP